MDSQKLSLILNGVLVVAIIILVAFGLKEGNFGGVDKQTLQSKYIALDIYDQRDNEAKKMQQEIFQKDSELFGVKEKLKELEASCDGVDESEAEKDECSFKDLSKDEQQKYRLKAKTVKKSAKSPQPDYAKAQITTSLTCDEHLKGSHYLPVACKTKLLAFIKKNKDAKRFNVVGVVDTNDFDFLTGLKKNEEIQKKLKVTSEQLEQFERIAPLGLARARAKEAMQLVKKELGKDTFVTQASYELVLEDKRGFVIQAFE